MKLLICQSSFLIPRINPRYRPLVDILLFCLITYGFHELWWWLAPYFKPTICFQETGNFLTAQVFYSSGWILDYILGWNFSIQDPTTFIFAKPESGIRDLASLKVNESCSGLKQFFQVLIIFLIFPGPWKHKLWYIPLSILLMHLVNIFRIVILCVILVHKPEYWQFTHDWILRPFFYVIIFLEWLIWVSYFRQNPL